jgi:hypothetical protein
MKGGKERMKRAAPPAHPAFILNAAQLFPRDDVPI